MILTAKEIEKITLGALRILEENGEIIFSRFSEKQEAWYDGRDEDFHHRARHSASVLLDFTTDSRELSFDYRAEDMVSRNFHYFDIYENDMLILHQGSEDEKVTEGKIAVKLSVGMKRVRIYFPFSRSVFLKNFALDDGAAVIPKTRSLKALILGDSITHGYDAKYPSLSYVNLMTERYLLNYVNQAVGGENFNQWGLGSEPLFTPDLITVAMGINDWEGNPFDKVERDCDGYFKTLRELYSDTPIIYISPIWTDRENRKPTFHSTIEMLESIASSYGAHVIHGLDLVPHDGGMYSDGLHPSDLGFTEYTKKLFAKTDGIISLIKKAKEEKEIGLTVL